TESVVPWQAFQISVEDDADKFTRATDHRAAGVAPDDVIGADKVIRSLEIQGRLALLPRGRQIKRRPVLHRLGPLIKTRQRGEGSDGFAVLLVTLDRAE